MLKRYVALVFLAFFSNTSYSNVLEIEPYRDAQLVKSQSNEGVMVEVPVSAIRRAGSGWEPEKVIRLTGDYISSLYKIDRNALLPDVYRHYRLEMLKNGREVVFECSSRSCGSSNAWANNFFKDYLLYGGDQNQFLLVVKNAQDVYQVLYLNRRGAGDVMVRLDEAKSVEARDTEFDIVAQMDVQDIPRMRRFIQDLEENQYVVAFVSSRKNGSLSALRVGDQLINAAISGLGRQLSEKVRFINLADLGRESLGVNRVSFVYERR